MSRTAEIVEDDAIADAFADLSRNAHEVTLSFERRAIHYPISVATVDRDDRVCVLDVTSLGDIEALLAESRPSFVLRARRSSALWHSAPMTIERILRRGPRLGLYCRLPDRLFVSHQRWDFRAALAEGMQVDVGLKTPSQTVIRGWLQDLSVGGCRLCFERAAAADLLCDDRLYQLRARFPNQEVFEAYSRIRYRIENTDANRVQIGLAFDIGLFDIERRMWFYVREIERETVRHTETRDAERRLAHSRLFAIDAPRVETGSKADGND